MIKKSKVALGPEGIKPYPLKKGEAYMNEAQLTHFKNILETWKEQLLADMDKTVNHMQNDAANFPDPIDRASQEEGFALELRTRDRELKLIKKIDETLENIKSGDYGYCLDCGAEIGIRRLEARPIAIQCIECKTVAEIREQQTGE
jgi:DnaK suppressor protein